MHNLYMQQSFSGATTLQTTAYIIIGKRVWSRDAPPAIRLLFYITTDLPDL